MRLLNIWLFLFIIFVVLCINYSSEDFTDWFNYNNRTQSEVSSETSSQTPVTQILSSTSSDESYVSPVFPTKSQEISSTSVTTPSSTSSTTSTTTPSTTAQTSPSTSPSTSSTTKTTSTTPSTTRAQPSIRTEPSSSSSSSVNPSPETTTKSSSEQTFGKCLEIQLNAKIIFKYNSTEGIEQQFETIGGQTNGELIHSNKCQRSQTLIVRYDLVEKTQLIVGITIDENHISFDRIRFEYPFDRLPEDFNKDNHLEEVETCSVGQTYTRTVDKCLIAETEDLSDLSLKYTIDEQIFCRHLPLIVLNNKKTSIDLLLTDLKLVVTNGQTNGISKNSEFCPLISDNNDKDIEGLFAGTTRIWVGISMAAVGAVLMFGFAFVYEKFCRERLLYKAVDRQDREEPEI